MKQKDKDRLFINQFLRGGTKCIPIAGAGIEEIIFGFKDKQQAQEEKEILWKTLDEIKKSQKIDQMTGLQVIELLLELTKEYDVVQKSIDQFIEIIQSKNQQIIKYLTATIDSLNKSLNLKYYIDLKCHSQENLNKSILLKEYISQWLKNPKIKALCILGDFGTGKTTYAQKLTLESAMKYLEDPHNEYLPILIDLRSFTHVKSIEELLKNALMWKGIDYKDFLQLSQDGRILFILDGFDEMSPDTRIAVSHENFIEINKLISNNNRIIITSRTHYFKQRKDEEAILRDKNKDFTGINIINNKNIEIIYIENFNEEDIKRYLKLYFGSRWNKNYEKMKSIYDLHELAYRPILLNLIVQTLPELDDFKGEITSYRLYDTYIDGWTKREQWRDIRPEDVLFLMEELAFEMFVSSKIYIIPEKLMEIIKDRYEQKILVGLVNLESFDGKIRTASFLYRDENDHYSFMHKSFMEFFVAKKFAKEIEREEKNKESFGKEVLTPEITYFIKDMINNIKKLYKLIEFTKGKSYDQIKYLGGNAITILKFLNESFEGKDFSMTVLAGANISNCNLNNTNFSKSILREVDFRNSILKNADLSFSDLMWVKLWEGNVNCIAWSPDGKYIAVGGDDTFVRIWDTKNYTELTILKGHKNSVKCLIWSPDCSFLVSGSRDKNIMIWDTHKWQLLNTLVHNDEVVSLTWNKIKNFLISSDSGGHIIIWDAGWNIIHKLTKKRLINRLGFLNTRNYLVVSSEEGIEIIDGDTFNQILQLCNFSSICGINEKNNILIYATNKIEKFIEKDYGEGEYRIEKEYKTELNKFDFDKFIYNKIKSWECEELSDNDGYGTFESDSINQIVDTSLCNNSNNFSIILYHYHHWYEPDGDETLNIHNYYLVFYNDKIELKIVPIGERKSFSQYDDMNILHPVIDYSNDGKYLALGDEGEAIQIFDADPESPNFGRGHYTKLIKFKGLNIQGIKGLTKDQIKFLKGTGAVGEDEVTSTYIGEL